MEAEDSYAAAAVRIVSVRAREVIDNAEGVLDTTDIEILHDVRVATRRLRAALEIFEPCFPAKPWKAALGEVKALADALGERRDRDVAIDALTAFAVEMPAPDRPGIASLIAELRAEQRVANDALAASVTPSRLAALLGRLAELSASVEAAEKTLPRREEAAADIAGEDRAAKVLRAWESHGESPPGQEARA